MKSKDLWECMIEYAIENDLCDIGVLKDIIDEKGKHAQQFNTCAGESFKALKEYGNSNGYEFQPMTAGIYPEYSVGHIVFSDDEITENDGNEIIKQIVTCLCDALENAYKSVCGE
jgi:hypothetical protein